MVASGIAKTATWLIRLFQLFFALILTGIVSYMIDQHRKYNRKYDYSVPDELIVSEVASVLALFVSVFSILAVCFLGYFLQLVAAFLDFAIFVLYIASVAMLRHNFHDHYQNNPLARALIWLRTDTGHDARTNRNDGMVKMLVAGVVIQIILFFITTILSIFVARRHDPDAAARPSYRGWGRRGRHTTVV